MCSLFQSKLDSNLSGELWYVMCNNAALRTEINLGLKSYITRWQKVQNDRSLRSSIRKFTDHKF